MLELKVLAGFYDTNGALLGTDRVRRPGRLGFTRGSRAGERIVDWLGRVAGPLSLRRRAAAHQRECQRHGNHHD